MKKLKSIVNSQKSAIVLMLIINLFQLRETGLIRIKIKEIAHQLSLAKIDMERHRDTQK